MRELEESHFIRKYRAFGKRDKNSIYQLTDFYSLFYLQWIKGSDPLDQDYWVSRLDTPKQNTWAGYAFEQVYLEHISKIKPSLSIGGMKTETSAWSGKTLV